MIRKEKINGKEVIAYSYETPITSEDWDDLIIKERSFRQQEGGYQVQGKWFHSDQPSKVQQIGLIIAGQNIPSNLMWKTMDGSFVLMTPTLAQQVFFAAVTRESELFAQGEALRAKVRQPDFDPDTFDWTKGWGTCYWERT
jgi:hypothetical protein